LGLGSGLGLGLGSGSGLGLGLGANLLARDGVRDDEGGLMLDSVAAARVRLRLAERAQVDGLRGVEL
jgi:hypothetical protein